MAIYDAAMEYVAEKTPLVIFAGKEYGTGSSRDWAAKGTACSAFAPSSPRASSASTAPT
jgi:aconitase A